MTVGVQNKVALITAITGQDGSVDLTDRVAIDPRYHRPTEVDCLLGDPSKAKRELGWQPRLSFEQLVHMMVDADLELAERERAAKSR